MTTLRSLLQLPETVADARQPGLIVADLQEGRPEAKGRSRGKRGA